MNSLYFHFMRYSLGEHPSMRLNRELKCCSEEKPVSPAISESFVALPSSPNLSSSFTLFILTIVR